jgi:pimeloyl-ACP methyl ester carboxylesterase
MKKITLLAALAASMAAMAGNLTDKIAEKHKIVATDKFYGFDRTRFEFQGCTAWIVEPSIPALESKPWTWTMQWATAFVPRTPALQLLRQGWHHVTIETFKYRMNDEGVAISKAFQDYLVKELGFAPKTCLIGLSWGGFFSTRYTAAHPENVAAIYYDCPLLNFNKFGGYDAENLKGKIGPWADSVPADWSKDPRMPVNMAEKIAAAKIPAYLIYGGADNVVAPGENSELFAKRFKDAGGDIKVVKRGAYGHHPHGVEIDDASVANFFRKTLKK